MLSPCCQLQKPDATFKMEKPHLGWFSFAYVFIQGDFDLKLQRILRVLRNMLNSDNLQFLLVNLNYCILNKCMHGEYVLEG